jgi:hypothetical protein
MPIQLLLSASVLQGFDFEYVDRVFTASIQASSGNAPLSAPVLLQY